MTCEYQRCGNCANWVITSKHGGKGGSRRACKPEQVEYFKQFEGSRYWSDDTWGYGAHHQCHRPDDWRDYKQPCQ